MESMICIILGKMTDIDKIMHPQHFVTDLMDIRIWINPKIWIRIWVTFSNFCIGGGLHSMSALIIIVRALCSEYGCC